MSNLIASSKQWLNGFKITNWIDKINILGICKSVKHEIIPEIIPDIITLCKIILDSSKVIKFSAWKKTSKVHLAIFAFFI